MEDMPKTERVRKERKRSFKGMPHSERVMGKQKGISLEYFDIYIYIYINIVNTFELLFVF